MIECRVLQSTFLATQVWLAVTAAAYLIARTKWRHDRSEREREMREEEERHVKDDIEWQE